MTRFADLEKITEFPDDAQIVVQPDDAVPPVRMDLDLVVPPAGTFTAEDEEKLDGIEDEATADQTGAEIAGLLNELKGGERVDVAAVKDAATRAQAHLGLFELSLNGADDVADTLHLRERNDPDGFPAGTKFYIAGGDSNTLKGKVIRRTSTAFGSVSEADFRTNFSDYWEVILEEGGETQEQFNAAAIGALEAKTPDLHAGEIIPSGWQNAPSADGGLDHGQGGTTRPNQAYARGVSAWAQEVTKRGSYIVARIRADLARAQARVRYVSKPTSSGRILRETFLLSSWHKIGSSANGSWDYYVNPAPIGTAVATLDLETTSDSDHVGTSRFSGIVDGTLEDGIVDEDALAQAVKDKLNADDSGTGTIADGSVTHAKLASDAVETENIKDDNVTEAKIADAFVTKVSSAQSAATAAQGAAVAAQADATRALADAVAAQNTADTADDKADTAITAAANADADAVAAQTTADAALPKTGGTMTGKIVLDGAPTDDLHPATKKYVDDNEGSGFADGLTVPQWSSLSGTIKKGAVVEHNDFFFISRLQHTKQATGPDGDPANWWDLGEWWGVISTQKYYPEGATGKTGNGNTLKIWRASEFIHDTDPIPTHADNVKWKQIWPAAAPGNLTDEEKAAWRTAIGTAEPTDARKERITFQATGRADSSDGDATRPRVIDLAPIATDPISVVAGDGDPEFITASGTDDFTLGPNVYLGYFEGDIRTRSANNAAYIQIVDDADPSTTLIQSSTAFIRGQHTERVTKILVFNLSAETTVRARLRCEQGDVQLQANSRLTLVRLSGDPSSVAALEAQLEQAEDNIAALQQDVSENESAIQTGVQNAEKFASDLVANLVFGDAGSVTEWPEDSPPAADAPQRIFVSETLTRNYTVPAANSKETSAETVAISHEPGLYELTTGAGANQIEIEVGKSAAVSGGSDVDYGATLRVFDWHKNQQFRHVPPVGKVLHSPLGSAVSGFVELTNGASHDSYAMLLENSLWQAWTVFGERTFFAHMNRTKQDGTVLHEAVELGGSDPIVTVHGVSYRVFSPFAPIPSAKQHFLRQAYEENQGDSAAAVAARKVTIYFNGAVDDTSTRFFLGNSAKGYTLVETDYGTERPVLSPGIRHLSALTSTEYASLASKESDTIYAVEGAGLYHGEDLLGSPGEDVLLWEHTAPSSDWHPSGEQLGSGVSTAIYNGIGGDNPWSRLEAEVKWTETIDSVGHEHVGLLTFPGWRKGSILPARPLRLHGMGRIGGRQNTSTMNAILSLVSRNDERTNPSHLFIEGFNTPGDTGIGSATQITVKLWGVR